jgi:hypothetical protein
MLAYDGEKANEMLLERIIQFTQTVIITTA